MRCLVGALWMTLVVAACLGPAAPTIAPEHANVRILSGRADAGESGLSITTADWTYGGGYGFAWTDAAGSRHENGRPDCLPTGASRPVTFAATEVTVHGTTWRPIVWLDCR